VLSVILLALVAVATPGCSHDTLNSASQDLTVTFTPDPAGAGRYERAPFIINKIEVLPADPETAALYGTKTLRLRNNEFTAQLTATQDLEMAHISLGTGTYKVTLLEIGPPGLVDENVSATPATCIEGIEVIDGSRPPGQVPSTFSFVNSPSLTFTIRPGQTKLAMAVNIPGLIAGYESSYTCQSNCGGSGSPCLTAFDATAFRAVVLANLAFE
jgi:hypothetical protein